MKKEKVSVRKAVPVVWQLVNTLDKVRRRCNELALTDSDADPDKDNPVNIPTQVLESDSLRPT